MRLLECNSAGELVLTKDFIGDDVPLYAILSHTWGADSEEVTFKDLTDGTGKSKLGYEKIRFCGKQAGRNRLRYFWVDTCCIDKTSSAELSEAINSMFQWYAHSRVCYVYLEDFTLSSINVEDNTCRVCCTRSSETESSSDQWCVTCLRKCRWFTRGWTLQELIAPGQIMVYDKNWELIGNLGRFENKLKRDISSITGIPHMYLNGATEIQAASIAQRMSWASKRETTRVEDVAYCLLGIFDVNMPLLYGEGSKAFIRLQEEIMKYSDDQSLFAWNISRNPTGLYWKSDVKASWNGGNPLTGLLAPSPKSFLNSSTIIPARRSRKHTDAPYLMTNRGLRIDLPLLQNAPRGGALTYESILRGYDLYYANLRCIDETRPDSPLALVVVRLEVDSFARYHSNEPIAAVVFRPLYRDITPSSIYFPKNPTFPEEPLEGFWARRAKKAKISLILGSTPFSWSLSSVLPPTYWDANSGTVSVPSGTPVAFIMHNTLEVERPEHIFLMVQHKESSWACDIGLASSDQEAQNLCREKWRKKLGERCNMELRLRKSQVRVDLSEDITLGGVYRLDIKEDKHYDDDDGHSHSVKRSYHDVFPYESREPRKRRAKTNNVLLLKDSSKGQDIH